MRRSLLAECKGGCLEPRAQHLVPGFGRAEQPCLWRCLLLPRRQGREVAQRLRQGRPTVWLRALYPAFPVEDRGPTELPLVPPPAPNGAEGKSLRES